MTDYGRGRSTGGKTHLRDPIYTSYPMCGASGVLNLYKPGPEARAVVECKRCAASYDKWSKIWTRREAIKAEKEAANG